MQRPTRRYRPAQLLFGILFLLSSCLLFFSVTNALGSRAPAPPTETPGGAKTPGGPETPTPPPPPVAPADNSFFAVVLPLVTSVLSLVGLVSTTFLAWRKERRDSRLSDLELQRSAIELERARLELERLKSQGDQPRGKGEGKGPSDQI